MHFSKNYDRHKNSLLLTEARNRGVRMVVNCHTSGLQPLLTSEASTGMERTSGKHSGTETFVFVNPPEYKDVAESSAKNLK